MWQKLINAWAPGRPKVYACASSYTLYLHLPLPPIPLHLLPLYALYPHLPLPPIPLLLLLFLLLWPLLPIPSCTYWVYPTSLLQLLLNSLHVSSFCTPLSPSMPTPSSFPFSLLILSSSYSLPHPGSSPA